MKSEIVIVGGGITGILCALRLSQGNNSHNQNITLLDSHETLGGRFFFANTSANGLKSGFGFEAYDMSDLDTLKRHLFLYLTDEEKNFLDNYLQEKIQKHPFQTLRQKKYFIKKDFLNAEYILLSNSEFLTKKEAEALHKIANFHKTQTYEKEKHTRLENSDLWKNEGKNIQENILPILECVLGKYALKLPLMNVCAKLQTVFYEQLNYHDPFFLRTSEIELAFEEILKKREVNVYTKCTLKSFQEEGDGYRLILSRSLPDAAAEIFCQKIIFTIPPYALRSLIPKENFSTELARFVSKVQPTSLVCLEINDFQNKLAENMENQFHTLDTLYFPVEGAAARIRSDDCLQFFIELDYETSLQAPAVRDALTHLRRAARRVLKQEFSDELKKGAFIRKTESFERMILLPIANNLPQHIQVSELPELNDVSLRLKNVYVAGDYFYSLGDTMWKRIVKSVENLCHQE